MGTILLPALLASLLFQQDRTETLGLSYAQILQMGPARRESLVLKRQDDSTPATAMGIEDQVKGE